MCVRCPVHAVQLSAVFLVLSVKIRPYVLRFNNNFKIVTDAAVRPLMRSASNAPPTPQNTRAAVSVGRARLGCGR
eukprot:SAG25_NODE_295_length_10249_cov_5.144926_7_plen_75_part_00